MLLSVGCARDAIPNTDVEDTAENREVVEFVELYRDALNERDVSALLGLASNEYFDDNGTPGADDDLDYGMLQEKLAQWRDALLDVSYDIRYRRVTFTESNRILVDYTYSGRFRLATPEGDRWARRLADNRLVLVRNAEGEFRILSGM